MHLTTTHFIFLVITMFIGLLPGFLAAKKIKSVDDYSIGGRSLDAGIVAGCIIGTIVGGAATVGTAQLGFKLGLPAWWFTLGSGISLFMMAYIYAKPLRESKLTTIAQYIEINYGEKAGILASVSASAGIFFSIVASSLTSIYLISSVFNLDILTSVFLIMVIACAIVFWGGLSSSAWTGIFKVVIIFATIFLGGCSAYINMGEISGMRTIFTDDRWFSLFGQGIRQALLNLLSMVVGIVSTQSYVQAVFSAKDSKTAVRGCTLAAVIVVLIGLPSVIIGMFMSVHHPEIRSIDALPMYILNYLPQWLGGIGIAALLLSALGSIAGLALGIATMITNGIVQKALKKVSCTKLLIISRLNVFLVISMALCFTCYHLDSTVLKWNFLSMALRGSGIFLPLTFAVLGNRKISPQTGLYAMISSIVIACFWNELHIASVDALFVSLAVGFIIFLSDFLKAAK